MNIYIVMIAAMIISTGCSDENSNPLQNSGQPSIKKSTYSQELLAQLVSLDAIGLNMAYVEKIAGPPMRSEEHNHQFNISGCDLKLKSDEKDKVVRSVQVAVTSDCDVDISGILGLRERLPLKSLTFGKFDSTQTSGKYFSDCLGDCGNSYVPNIYLVAHGSRAMQFNDVMVYAPQTDSSILEAKNHWVNAISAKESAQWIFENKYNCSSEKYKDAASVAFDSIKPSFIAFGSDLDYPKCPSDKPLETIASEKNLGIFIPQPQGKCDMDYDQRLKSAGLEVNIISVHGPDDHDFSGYACPYRITPAPGTSVAPGSTVTYRSAWEKQ